MDQTSLYKIYAKFPTRAKPGVHPDIPGFMEYCNLYFSNQVVIKIFKERRTEVEEMYKLRNVTSAK